MDSALLDAFTRQKGVACVDDVDAEPPQRLKVQPHHEVVIAVEYCTAPRPSSSLRGSREKYDQMFNAVGPAVSELCDEGELTVRKASPREVEMAAKATKRVERVEAHTFNQTGVLFAKSAMRPQARPMSANPRLEKAESADEDCPRLGSFEVLFMLINRQSGQKYGPTQIHSKLVTRRWPLFDKLRQRMEVHLQEFLAKDSGNFEYHQARERRQSSLSFL